MIPAVGGVNSDHFSARIQDFLLENIFEQSKV
jgi:hypothetical protein